MRTESLAGKTVEKYPEQSGFQLPNYEITRLPNSPKFLSKLTDKQSI